MLGSLFRTSRTWQSPSIRCRMPKPSWMESSYWLNVTATSSPHSVVVKDTVIKTADSYYTGHIIWFKYHILPLREALLLLPVFINKKILVQMAELFGSSHPVCKGLESLDLKSTVNFQAQTFNSVPKHCGELSVEGERPGAHWTSSKCPFLRSLPVSSSQRAVGEHKATVLCIHLQSWWTGSFLGLGHLNVCCKALSS